jgi:hypothetical protein
VPSTRGDGSNRSISTVPRERKEPRVAHGSSLTTRQGSIVWRCSAFSVASVRASVVSRTTPMRSSRRMLIPRSSRHVGARSLSRVERRRPASARSVRASDSISAASSSTLWRPTTAPSGRGTWRGSRTWVSRITSAYVSAVAARGLRRPEACLLAAVLWLARSGRGRGGSAG